MRAAKAFTLVEILIVVMLLGVLAAVVIPAVARSGTNARETALASDVALLRRFVMVYTSHHLEVAPGYPNGDPTAEPTNGAFVDQATLSSNARGQTAAAGTAGFNFGPYLSRIPVNPLNNQDTVHMVLNGDSFPAAADGNHGWIFKPETGEIRPDNLGANERGVAYYDY
ncbi:MAG: type II secretion system GspH family protein [Planctomycetes bacterium]|jgi:prepilin-type N-terminal cleavage/methylation domain-containing protein|nr:type II secretion system GspH family protein [Planctomycetota bacterium]